MRLRRLLLQIDETFEIEGPVTSVGETAAMLRNDYDIIFADIRLDERPLDRKARGGYEQLSICDLEGIF